MDWWIVVDGNLIVSLSLQGFSKALIFCLVQSLQSEWWNTPETRGPRMKAANPHDWQKHERNTTKHI